MGFLLLVRNSDNVIVSKGGIHMKCGSKCFLIEMELDGETIIKRINERTPVSARKVIRKQYGADAVIISAVEEKRNS